MIHLRISLLTLFLAIGIYTNRAQATIDDSGLTGPVQPLKMSVSTNLGPSEIVKTPLKSNDLTVSSYIRKGGKLIELLHLSYASVESCQTRSVGDEIAFESELTSQYIDVKKSGTYRVQFTGECGSHHDLIFESESPEGQAVVIWEVANRAVSKFAQINRLDFWGGPLQISWPADGDYYSWGTVYLTRGDYWDVVGHEIGHAIYDRANIGVSGGGQHYIDQCYTDSLALSEGWASFFSAWVSVDTKDPNAQFEFMVPRRAPLGIETVPDDVCAGPTNEWRVYAFLWDIIDHNDDGEVSNLEFLRYWDLAYNQNTRSMAQKTTNLVRGGIDRDHLNKIWELNFKTPVVE
jgi:hypothetical protein